MITDSSKEYIQINELLLINEGHCVCIARTPWWGRNACIYSIAFVLLTHLDRNACIYSIVFVLCCSHLEGYNYICRNVLNFTPWLTHLRMELELTACDKTQQLFCGMIASKNNKHRETAYHCTLWQGQINQLFTTQWRRTQCLRTIVTELNPHYLTAELMSYDLTVLHGPSKPQDVRFLVGHVYLQPLL